MATRIGSVALKAILDGEGIDAEARKIAQTISERMKAADKAGHFDKIINDLEAARAAASRFGDEVNKANAKDLGHLISQLQAAKSAADAQAASIRNLTTSYGGLVAATTTTGKSYVPPSGIGGPKIDLITGAKLPTHPDVVAEQKKQAEDAWRHIRERLEIEQKLVHAAGVFRQNAEQIAQEEQRAAAARSQAAWSYIQSQQDVRRANEQAASILAANAAASQASNQMQHSASAWDAIRAGQDLRRTKENAAAVLTDNAAATQARLEAERLQASKDAWRHIEERLEIERKIANAVRVIRENAEKAAQEEQRAAAARSQAAWAGVRERQDIRRKKEEAARILEQQSKELNARIAEQNRRDPRNLDGMIAAAMEEAKTARAGRKGSTNTGELAARPSKGPLPPHVNDWTTGLENAPWNQKPGQSIWGKMFGGGGIGGMLGGLFGGGGGGGGIGSILGGLGGKAVPMLGMMTKAAEGLLAPLTGVLGTLYKIGLFAGGFAAWKFLSFLTNAAEGALRTAAEFEKTAKAFGVLVGSDEYGKGLFEESIKVALETPFKMAEVVKETKKLMAYGVNSMDTHDTLRQLAAAASGTGVDIGRLTLAYGQVKAKGRFQASELRQFTEAGIGVEDFARTAGISNRALLTKMEANEIGFDVVRDTFKNMAGKGGRFYGMNEAMLDTVGGRWNQVFETLEVYLAKVGQKFFDAFKFKDIFKNIAEAFNNPESIRKAGDWFGRIAEIMPTFSTALGRLWDRFSTFSSGILEALPTWKEVEDWFVKFDQNVLPFAIAGLKAFGVAMSMVAGIAVTIANQIVRVSAGLLKAALGDENPNDMALARWIKGGVRWAAEGVAELGGFDIGKDRLAALKESGIPGANEAVQFFADFGQQIKNFKATPLLDDKAKKEIEAKKKVENEAKLDADANKYLKNIDTDYSFRDRFRKSSILREVFKLRGSSNKYYENYGDVLDSDLWRMKEGRGFRFLDGSKLDLRRWALTGDQGGIGEARGIQGVKATDEEMKAQIKKDMKLIDWVESGKAQTQLRDIMRKMTDQFDDLANKALPGFKNRINELTSEPLKYGHEEFQKNVNALELGRIAGLVGLDSGISKKQFGAGLLTAFNRAKEGLGFDRIQSAPAFERGSVEAAEAGIKAENEQRGAVMNAERVVQILDMIRQQGEQKKADDNRIIGLLEQNVNRNLLLPFIGGRK